MSRLKAWKFRGFDRDFLEEDDGLALSEYLILLGLLTAGVIAAVMAISVNMQKAWTEWSSWFESNVVVLAGPDRDIGGSDTPAAAAPPVASQPETSAAAGASAGASEAKSKKSKKEK